MVGSARAGGYITLKDGQTLEYDWLVLALGAETVSFGIPGVRELALPFCTYDDAVRVRITLAQVQGTGSHPSCSKRSHGFGLVQDQSNAATAMLIELEAMPGCPVAWVAQWRSVAISAVDAA